MMDLTYVRRALPPSFVKAVAELAGSQEVFKDRRYDGNKCGPMTEEQRATRRRVQTYLAHAKKGKVGDKMLTALLGYAGLAGSFDDVMNLGWQKIESIKACGKMDTLDIEIHGPRHAYVANGLLTHNSAQDLIQLAMIRLHEDIKERAKEDPRYRDVHFILQVHDEIGMEAPKGIAESVLKRMRYRLDTADSGHLRVELESSGGCGKRWTDAH